MTPHNEARPGDYAEAVLLPGCPERAQWIAETLLDEPRRVNAVRGVTRPALTLLLWLIAGMIWLGADMAARASITETAAFAATAATLWWFGDRGPKRDSGA